MSDAEEISLLLTAVGRIEGTQEQILAAVNLNRTENNTEHHEIFKRLSSVEADINQAKGVKGAVLAMAAALTAAISVSIAFITAEWK